MERHGVIVIYNSIWPIYNSNSNSKDYMFQGNSNSNG